MTSRSPATSVPAELAEVRAAIDAIDAQVVHLLAARESHVRRAATLKTSEDGVRAPARVDDVLRKVRTLAADAGATPDVVEQVYRTMISAFIDLELREHRTGTR